MRAPPYSFKTCLFLCSVCLLMGLTSDVYATAVSGQVSVWSYMRDDSVDHAMVAPSLSLNAYQLGHRDLTFQTTLRGFTDIRNGESNEEQMRIQRAVLIYSPRESKWQVRLGQQWINEGVGFGNVAGVWAQVKPCPMGSLTAYAGSRIARTMYFDSEDGDNADEGINAGLHLKRRFGKTNVGLSYTYLAKDGDVLFSGAGIDASSKLCKDFSVRGRLHMNLEQSSIETAQLLGMWTPINQIMLTGEVRSQTPRIFEDSYFTRFLEDASTNFARGTVRWNFYDEYYVKYSGHVLMGEDYNPWKIRAGLGCDNLELGYTHWLSVAEGDYDGFYGMATGDIEVNGRDYGDIFAGFDFAKGSNSDIRKDTESQSAYYGVRITRLHAFDFSARMEHIKSWTESNDWRGLFGITWRFSTLAGGVR
ncbi:hypothetical protein EH220_07895 [bacterium]|nr:MAG: hypothetical protein EH220_07895 [bacterium]